MRLVSGIVLAIILSLMLWMTKESTSHLHEDRERDRDRKGWSFNRLSKWPSAVIWTILNLIASLLILSLTMGVRYTFIGGLWEIIIVGLFGIFSLFVIIGIIISRFDFIGWKFSWFVLLGIVFWVVLLLTSLAIIPKPSGVVSNISHFLDKPGTLFVAILGLITITGFIVTISQLHETNARITDYPTLLRRLTFLLEEAVGPATGWRSLSPIGKIARKFRVLCGHEFENDEHVRIYVRTLALGSMSTPKQVFDRYGRALKDLFAHGKSMVVQLDHSNLPDIPSSKEDISKIEPILSQSEVGKLYLYFKKRGFSAREIVAGYNESKEYGVWPHQRGKLLTSIDGDDKLPKHVYFIRLPKKSFPTYHLFISSKRAIVVTALDLPIGDDGSEQIEGWKVGPIHVVAVETTNLQVVAELTRTFKAICKQCCTP